MSRCSAWPKRIPASKPPDTMSDRPFAEIARHPHRHRHGEPPRRARFAAGSRHCGGVLDTAGRGTIGLDARDHLPLNSLPNAYIHTIQRILLMRTWFITGASRGFGTLIAARALAAGDAVVATAREPVRRPGRPSGPRHHWRRRIDTRRSSLPASRDRAFPA
jgi:hypothetical protein